MYGYARKVLFLFLFFQDFQKFPPDSNVISGKIRSARAPDLQIARFDLPLSALLQCLLLRAVRSLLLMRSLTDATIQVWSCTSVRVAQTKPNCKKKYRRNSLSSFQTVVLLLKRSISENNF